MQRRQTDESVTGAGRTVRILGARHERKCPLCDSLESFRTGTLPHWQTFPARPSRRPGRDIAVRWPWRSLAASETKKATANVVRVRPREERQRRVSNPLTFPRLAARLNHPPT